MTEQGETPDRHEPLSKWSKFFLCVGLYLAEKKESRRDKTKFYTDIESNNGNCCNKPNTED